MTAPTTVNASTPIVPRISACRPVDETDDSGAGDDDEERSGDQAPKGPPGAA